jgi:transcriptional regulator with XRE-family HTH domain
VAQNPVSQHVAENVRAEMARRWYSGTMLAKALGVSQSFLSRRLTGAVPFNVVELHAIADALHIDVCELLRKKGQ